MRAGNRTESQTRGIPGKPVISTIPTVPTVSIKSAKPGAVIGSGAVSDTQIKLDTLGPDSLATTTSASETVISKLNFSNSYLHGMTSHFNRYRLIRDAIDASAGDTVVPLRAVGRRGYKSNILALETWLLENLSLIETERLSPDAHRDLEITTYCAVAAGIAAQRPTLFNIMSQVVDVLSNSYTNEDANQATNPVVETQLDIRNLAARLVELNEEVSRYTASIETWERRLAGRIQEFDLLSNEILSLKSHMSNLKSLIVAKE